MINTKFCDRLLIGVTGSTHANYIYIYLSIFETFANHIKIVATETADQFIDSTIIDVLIGETAYIHEHDQSSFSQSWDSQLSDWAELFVIFPATESIIKKAIYGITDSRLSTIIANYSKPIVFVPAVSSKVWQIESMQQNSMLLKKAGHYIIPPGLQGMMLEADEQKVVFPPPETVLLHLKHAFMKQLRNEYWEEAIREKPLTPIEKKLRDQKEKNVIDISGK